MTAPTDLPEIWQGIEVKWSEDWAPEAASIKNATRLLKALLGKADFPKIASRGYWPTVSFKWITPSIEVEVFAGHCELYHFENNELVGASIPEFKASKTGITPLLVALDATARPQHG